MTELMTREEMIKRIESGEDPVELSIEKWRRVRAIHPAEQIRGSRLESSTCALCYVNDSVCSVCKLKEITGASCMNDSGNHWGDAVSDSYHQEDNGGVDRLIELLEKCREVELMSGEEMVERIGEGEDPVELSIEKWERVEQTYLNRQLHTDEFAGETCALCHVSNDDCANCLFTLTHGHPCVAKQEDGKRYWDSAARDVRDRQNSGYVRMMIDALKKCKEGNKEIEPMSAEEMKRRIEEGEDPLTLSIEKWKRIKEIYLDRDVVSFVYDDTCPLCYTYKCLGSCDKCILVQEIGETCHEKGTWEKARKDVEERVDRGGLNGMIRLLEECREKNKKDEVMDRLLRVHTSLIQLSSNCEETGLNRMEKLLRSMAGEIELVLKEMKEEEE